MSTEEPSLPEWVILTRQHCAIRFGFADAWLTFNVFGAAEVTRPGAPTDWELIHCSEFHPLEEWQEAHCDIDGQLKWDGCINWQTHPQMMMHGCGPGHVDDLTAIFSTIYHIGKRKFDLLGDEAPPLPGGALER